MATGPQSPCQDGTPVQDLSCYRSEQYLAGAGNKEEKQLLRLVPTSEKTVALIYVLYQTFCVAFETQNKLSDLLHSTNSI